MASISDKVVLRRKLRSRFTQMANLLSQSELAYFGGPEKYIKHQVEYHTSDWYHYYLQFDVTEYLQKLKIPILALNGDRDNSVAADFNLGGLKKTLDESGNTRHELIKLKNVNHFFQPSDSPKIDSVYFNTETFSREALEIIADWISDL